MDNLILSHKTSLFLLNKIAANNQKSQLSEKSISEITRAFVDFNIENQMKLDILVDNVNKMGSSNKFRFHLKPKSLPRHSTFHLYDNVYCSSPEFTIIQLSKTLCYEHLFLLVLEFCGSYTIDREIREFISPTNPLTNINKINNFLKSYAQKNPHSHGLKLLESVLNVADNNSASPMESRLFIKLCGPRSRGLYACKNLKLNQKIKLSPKAAKIAGQSTVTPDIACLDRKIAIEYDSLQFHESAPQGQKDKRRRDALVCDG